MGAGTGGHGGAGWGAWLGTTLAGHTVHVGCSAGPLSQGLQGSSTGSPAGTQSGQEMGLSAGAYIWVGFTGFWSAWTGW